MRSFLREKQLKELLSTLIKPYIDYETLAWGGAAKNHLIKIDRSVRKTIRLMMFKEKRHTAKSLGEYLKMLPVSLDNKLLQAKFMKKRILKEHREIIRDKYPLYIAHQLTTLTKQNL